MKLTGIKKAAKRTAALGLALCMSVLPALGDSGVVLAQDADTEFTMEASSPTGEEDWASLKVDMKWAEEEETYGYWGTPLANGLFAAKENGEVQEDVFVLNHSTFWSGDPAYRDALYDGEGGYWNSAEEKAAGYEDVVSTLKAAYTEGVTVQERNSLMQSLNEKTQQMWESDEQSAFLSVGRMRMNFPELTYSENYKRTLDLDRAMSEVSFTKDGVDYLRETFISNPDNVMVTRLTNGVDTDMDMVLSLELHSEMNGKSDDNRVYVDEETQEIVMTGRAPYDFPATKWDENRGTLLEARAKIVLPEGGEITTEGNTLRVTDAPEILVLYTCETSFKDAVTDPSNSGVDYSGKVRETLDSALSMSYEELLDRHLEEYRSLFRRLWIDLEGEDILAADGRTYISPKEYALQYQYARYCMISCERENSVMPYGLFCMWSTEWVGVNEGAYFLNENMEKTQNLKGTANLADTSDAQYNFISSWAQEETGQRQAQTIYGAEGDDAWMMSHSTGIWAKSGMWGSQVEWGSWLSGGIWALDTLYDKYNYTQDISLLEKYFPLLEGAAEFALSQLIEVDGVNGELKGYKVVAPAGSPEHWYWVNGTKAGFDIASACDTLLYYNLFNMIEDGAEDLDRAGIAYDRDLVNQVKEAKEQMIPLEMFIDEETGRMKEWYNEYEIGEANHRHASHLLGLFLSNIDINEYDTPELYEAMEAEMYRWMTANGGAHPDRSLMAVRAGYEDFGLSHLEIVGSDYGHDAVMKWGPMASCIGESVVDSRFGEINLMENLTSSWSSGSVKGIRARGGYQLSLSWENGELTHCVIDSPTGETPRVLYKGEPVDLSADSRFTVNRAQTTLDDLKYEAGEKLDGKYTEESKSVLEAALETEDYDTISQALLAMVPVNYIEREVSVETENGVNVLSGRGNSLQLTASSDKEDAAYTWSIQEKDGGSAEQIASVDEDGVVTAVGGGVVTVTAEIEGEPYSRGTIDLLVEAETYSVKETIDDRDSRWQYSEGWLTWDEWKHRNGTITYSQEPGATAALTFTGSGFDFIGSSAEHIGNFSVTLDGEVLDDCVYSGNNGYNLVMYSKTGLEDTEHTVVITGLNDRIDVDALDIYGSTAPATDRSGLTAEYEAGLELTESDYTEESWNAFAAQLDSALAVLNNFDAAQEDITAALDSLTTAKNALEKSSGEPEEPSDEADKTALNLVIAMAEKLESEQSETGCYTDETWAAVQTSLDAARALAAVENASQENVDNAFLELITAVNLLENAVQRVALETAIEGARAILAEEEALADYTPESVENLRTVLAEAENVYALESADQETVNAAARSLMDAVTSLVVIDKDTRLDILIQKAEELLVSADQYTSASVSALNAALEAAYPVADDRDASEEQINAAYSSLAEAMSSLVRKADKSELQTALDKAAEILADTSKYVEESVAGLQAAADAAQAVYDQEDADAAAVGEAVKSLVDEILKTRLMGDVDGNGAVDSADSAEVLSAAAEVRTLDEIQSLAADVNGDGAADSSDAAEILQFAAEQADAL